MALRIYAEHPEFGEFTKFDTKTGRIADLPEDEFRNFLPADITLSALRSDRPVTRIVTDRCTVFLGQTPETHTRFPRRVYFQITRDCNLHCDYCYLKSKAGSPHTPTQAVLEMAAFLGRNGLMEVRLTGGEPTLHPGFFDIVRRFQEEDVYVSVATNGTMDRAGIDRLAEVENLWLICSVDGNRETHDRYRPGTFDLIIRNIKRLKRKSPSTRIRLTTVLTKSNKDQMHELGRICRSVGAESITVIPLRPQVRCPDITRDMVTADEFKQVIEDLVTAKNRFGIEFTTTIETDYFDKMYKDPVVRKRSSCAAGREATNLDYDAAKSRLLLYGCSYSPAADLDADPRIREPFLAGEFPAGRPEDFLRIWSDDSAWTLYRDLSLKSGECRTCEYYSTHRCVGSCPIQNVDFTSISADEGVLAQVKEQLQKTGEWYCYKRLVP